MWEEGGSRGILSPYLEIQQDSEIGTIIVETWAIPRLSLGSAERG